jgi:hypothetical protein
VGLAAPVTVKDSFDLTETFSVLFSESVELALLATTVSAPLAVTNGGGVVELAISNPLLTTNLHTVQTSSGPSSAGYGTEVAHAPALLRVLVQEATIGYPMPALPFAKSFGYSSSGNHFVTAVLVHVAPGATSNTYSPQNFFALSVNSEVRTGQSAWSWNPDALIVPEDPQGTVLEAGTVIVELANAEGAPRQSATETATVVAKAVSMRCTRGTIPREDLRVTPRPSFLGLGVRKARGGACKNPTLRGFLVSTATGIRTRPRRFGPVWMSRVIPAITRL